MTTASDRFGPDALLARLDACERARALIVAYSGGGDSLALLLAASRAGLDVTAVHVDHGLHPDSGHWAALCAENCRALGVDFTCLRVAPDTDAGLGIEGAAREARYAALADHAGTRTLMVAHHADDQAETVLLRLLRGAGPHGLSGMRRQRPLGRGTLLRPLLDVRRARLRDYVASSQLAVVVDPANADEQHDRSWLRQRIMPQLVARRPQVVSNLERLAALAAREQEALNWLMSRSVGRAGTALPLAVLRDAPARIRVTLVRTWLMAGGWSPPAERALARGLSDLIDAGRERAPVLAWPGGQLRRYRDELHALPRSMPDGPAHPVPIEVGAPVTVPGVGHLAWQSGGGVRAGGEGLLLRRRRGGESMHWRGHRRRVRELLRAAEIPPWERESLPLLVCDEEVVAVPGVAVADPWRDAAEGFMPHWRRVVP